jgi:sugar lactone lactonase YvrE
VSEDRQATRIASTGSTFVNGILTGRGGQLWWTETYTRTVRAATTDDPTSRIVATLRQGATPDGFVSAGQSLLLVCSGTTIEVVDTTDGVVGSIDFPEDSHVTNAVFHGEDLYVTDGGKFDVVAGAPSTGRLWRVRSRGLAGTEEIRGSL